MICVPGLDEEEGWDGFEMHGEKAQEGCNSKKDGGRGSKVSQVAVQSMEMVGKKSATVVDRDERVASPETQGTILESPINMEPLPLHRSDEMMQNTLFQEQLEKIDYELSKFDNVAVKGVAVENSEVMLTNKRWRIRKLMGLSRWAYLLAQV